MARKENRCAEQSADETKKQNSKQAENADANTANGEEVLSFGSNKTTEPTKDEPKADAKDIEIVKQYEEIERLKNAQMRLQADFENYKKRNIELGKKAYLDGEIDVITTFLPLIDTFDRALSMINPDDNSGIIAIKKQLDNILTTLNVKEIDALGNDFDPKFHDAVMQVEDSENADKVVEVLQKGYIYKEKIVRHSMVKVAK